LGYQDEALRSLEAFIQDYPASEYREEATDLLVGALANTNNYRNALSLIEGLKYPSQNTRRLYPRILYGRATELINDGQLQEAEELLDKALKDGNNASVLPLLNFWKGELAFRSGRTDEAIRYYNAYLDGGAPQNGEANATNAKYNLGYAYYRKENYGVAQTFFEPLSRNVSLNSDPVTQDAYVRTADVYYMNRSYAQARTMYDNVIRFSWPQEDYATYQKAMIAGINSSNEKISSLNTLIRKFPQSPLLMDANMEIANTYLAAEQFREAIPYLQTVAKAGGNSSLKPEAFLKQGIAQYNLNNNSEAIASYRKVISDYPNSPEAETALDNLKAVYVETGRPDEYATVMREAGKPLSVSAEDSLTFAAAELKYEGGNAAAALEALNAYLQRFANGAYATNAQYYRGEIFATRKEWKAALEAYGFVAEKAPNIFADRAVLQAARISFFELKDYPQAERFYTQLKGITGTQEGRLEAMRGLLRSQFLQKKWAEAVENATELLAQKSASSDDKALAAMAIGKSAQVKG
jgi:TolA-binding protein